MLWFQRYELLESRTRGNSVKLKTTFNLSRELLAPPEPPSPRRVNFSLLLGFHLAAVFVTKGHHLCWIHKSSSPPVDLFSVTATKRKQPSLNKDKIYVTCDCARSCCAKYAFNQT